MGHPQVTTSIEAHGHATPIASNALTADLVLRMQGLQSLRLDSTSQGASGKTLVDSLIYSKGLGYWTAEAQHTGRLYSAARYSHPQLMPLQVCSLDFLASNLSLQFAPKQDGDQSGTIRLRFFVDMRDTPGKTDIIEQKLSQMDVSLDLATYLPSGIS